MIPGTVVDVDGQYGHPVPARVLYQLRGAVKSHGLAVQQAGEESRRVVALEPGGGVGQQGEAGGVGFGEAVAGKAPDLLEQAAGEILVVAALDHAPGEFFLESEQLAVPAPVGNGPAQLVRLAAAETRRHHGQPDHLLLEDGHPQGALQYTPDGIRGIGDRFQPLLAPQVGVHHVALYGPGAHDGDLDHQVVETLGLQARQHGHLGPGLDLEYADGVGGLQHAVGGPVLPGNIIDSLDGWLVAVHQLQALADGGQHAQGQYVHLQQAQGLDVLLVPLDYRALGHSGVLHRYQGGDGAAGDNEPPHVLGQVAGKAQDFLHQAEEQPGFLAVPRHAAGRRTVLLEAFRQVGGAVPPGHGLAQVVHEHRVQAQGLAHVPHCAAGAVGDQGGGQGGALAAVLFVDVLDNLFAPLVLEVHVDIRWFVPLLRDEALEQQGDLLG